MRSRVSERTNMVEFHLHWTFLLNKEVKSTLKRTVNDKIVQPAVVSKMIIWIISSDYLIISIIWIILNKRIIWRGKKYIKTYCQW